MKKSTQHRLENLGCALLLALGCLGGCTKSKPTLGLLVWEGYASPVFIRAFENSHGCRVQASYMGSSDELIAKLRGGSAANYDVISPSSDVATMIVSAGLAAPLDLVKLPSYGSLMPRLTSMSLVKKDGMTYGVPFQWGPNPLLYDTSAFPQAPDDWAILWDPKMRGKVSVWDDLSTIYMAAQVLGFDKPDPHTLYNLSEEQLQRVKEKLLSLKPNIRKMWTTGGELTNLFEQHEIQIAMGWPLVTNELRKKGFPIGETIPKQNTTGWIDHLMITTASKQKALASELLEYLIQPNTQRTVSGVTGYLPSNPAVAGLLTAEERKSLHLDDLEHYQSRIYFWEDVPRRARYNQVWNEVKAAQ